MNITEEALKSKLMKIKEAHWELPEGVDPYELALEGLSHIGSIDPILRDKLIWDLFVNLIEERKLSYEQMKALLPLALSEEHLFCGVGREKDDSVFNRTFSVLVVGIILEADNKAEEGFLSKEDVTNAYEKVMEYARREIDYRGYVEEKGWAHSTAHTSDALCELAHSRYLGHKELLEIMELIKEKICIETYTYINEEEERLITTFNYIYDRKIVTAEEIVHWLQGFMDISSKDQYPNKEHLRENRKLFFRGLGYRAKKMYLQEEVTKVIYEILD